ncbi:unnamed protein product [Sphagnum balticum]
MQQAAAALSYMHSRSILHRDLKSQNMLLTHSCVHLKLTDFGNATIQRDDMTNNTGSASCMAPETYAILYNVVEKNTRPNEQPNFPPELDALMKHAWAHDATLRPTAAEVHRQLSKLMPMFPGGNIREK